MLKIVITWANLARGEMESVARKFSVTINTAWCKGCGLCVAICPKSVLELNEHIKAEPVRMEDCIGCHQCDYSCPDMAITVTKEGSD